MKKTTKIWLITAAALILVGGIIFGSVMTVLGWNFGKLSTQKYETNSYEFAENYKNITIKSNTADIQLVPAQNGKTSVVCYEAKNMKHSVSVDDDTLVIEVQDTRKWYEYIGIGFASPKVTVYLPEKEYGALLVETSTGRTQIPEDFKFSSIKISQSTGDVSLKASAAGDVKIKTSTGNISAENISAEGLELSVSTGDITVSDIKCYADIKINVSTGKAVLSNVRCKSLFSNGTTGNITLNNVVADEKFSIKRSTGDIKFESSDAKEIFVETDTGDITGTLLSEKIFSAMTDTGKVDVPKTLTGGICEVTTNTGNIKLKVK